MLVYQRVAYARKDGCDGFLYLHSWGTGCQELVFSSHEMARLFSEGEGIAFHPKGMKLAVCS